MSQKSYKYLSIVGWIVAIISTVLLLFCKGCGPKEEPQIIEKVDTVVVTKIDTIKIEKQVIKERIREVKVLDTIRVKDTVLIRVEKEYRDSIALIKFSGIDPTIDSIAYTIPEKTVTITKEITKIEKQKTGWSLVVGPYVGYGIGIKDKNVIATPEIGIGVSIGWGVILK